MVGLYVLLGWERSCEVGRGPAMLGEIGRGLHVYGFYFQYHFITRICHSNARKHFWRSKSEIESPIKYTFYTISTYIVIFVLLGKTFKISYQTGI